MVVHKGGVYLAHYVLHYTEIKFSLRSDCRKDPHQSQLGANCESCYSLLGWRGKELRFDHDKDTKFALTNSRVSNATSRAGSGS
jgi:hypothetical protein